MKGAIIGITKGSRHSQRCRAPSGSSAVAKMPQNIQLTVVTLPRLDRLSVRPNVFISDDLSGYGRECGVVVWVCRFALLTASALRICVFLDW